MRNARGCDPFQREPDHGNATAPSLLLGTGAIRRMRPAVDPSWMTRPKVEQVQRAALEVEVGLVEWSPAGVVQVRVAVVATVVGPVLAEQIEC